MPDNFDVGRLQQISDGVLQTLVQGWDVDTDIGAQEPKAHAIQSVIADLWYNIFPALIRNGGNLPGENGQPKHVQNATTLAQALLLAPYHSYRYMLQDSGVEAVAALLADIDGAERSRILSNVGFSEKDVEAIRSYKPSDYNPILSLPDITEDFVNAVKDRVARLSEEMAGDDFMSPTEILEITGDAAAALKLARDPEALVVAVMEAARGVTDPEKIHQRLLKGIREKEPEETKGPAKTTDREGDALGEVQEPSSAVTARSFSGPYSVSAMPQLVTVTRPMTGIEKARRAINEGTDVFVSPVERTEGVLALVRESLEKGDTATPEKCIDFLVGAFELAVQLRCATFFPHYASAFRELSTLMPERTECIRDRLREIYRKEYKSLSGLYVDGFLDVVNSVGSVMDGRGPSKPFPAAATTEVAGTRATDTAAPDVRGNRKQWPSVWGRFLGCFRR